MIAEGLRTFIELLIGSTLMSDPIISGIVSVFIAVSICLFALFLGLLPFGILYKLIKIKKTKKR